MTSDERILISSLFDRLKQAGTQPKDAEADDYIRGKVLEQPSAPYLLVQSTLVMQQALAAAQSRIAGSREETGRGCQSHPGTGRELPIRCGQSFWGGTTFSTTPSAPRANAATPSSAASSGVRLCSAAHPTSPKSRRRLSAKRAIYGRRSRRGSAPFPGHRESDRSQSGTIYGLKRRFGRTPRRQPARGREYRDRE